ncbi:hypothetical protein P8C59_004732 [Phyllachora maydis]|uniref:Uncharacterized protein n=1 Tax=Phyllachora maydis TaxID=1825666 RepID=A0AAD9I2Y0_9PEZI|nr:hypothetical protein P8C59_004732 [Phyllachora maydis]
MSGLSTMAHEKTLLFETGWSTPPTSIDGGMSRSHSISSGLTMLGTETNAPGPIDGVVTADMYTTSLPWTPPHDLPSQFADTSGLPLSSPHATHPYDVSMPVTATAGWMDTSPPDCFAYSQSQMPTPASVASTYFPSPATTPSLRTPRQKSASIGLMTAAGATGSCTCFTACLQSLQALHNASSPAAPPFDLVLSLNRKAVEGCATMLNCSRCMSRSGTQTAIMLLATVMGKITSFYKNASYSYFDLNTDLHGVNPISSCAANGSLSPLSSGLGISLGAYQLHGDDGRWLEIEILARELRRLEEVYGRFCEVCAELSDDPDMSRAMMGYLGHTLASTLDIINYQKDDAGYS